MSTGERNAGTYLGHQWSFDDQQRLVWDGQPYVPYTSFADAGLVADEPGAARDVHIWIDNDDHAFTDPEYLDRYLTDLSDAGGTYTILMMRGMPTDNDASTLMDPAVRERILASWEPYTQAIQKDGLRAVILWNEIDIDFTWPESHSADEYGQTLGDYAREMRARVGDIPVLFKLTYSASYRDDLATASIVAAATDDGCGLGIDVYATSCDDPALDSVAFFRERMSAQQATALLWVTEFGMMGEESEWEGDDACYWDLFPPYAAEEELRCHMDEMVDGGAAGFLYAGPTKGPMEGACDHLDYGSSQEWFDRAQTAVVQEIVDR